MKKTCLTVFIVAFFVKITCFAAPYTLIKAYDTKTTQQQTAQVIQQENQIRQKIKSPQQRLTDEILTAFQHFKNRPYDLENGEGDQLTPAGHYHILQMPLYTTQGFVCTTWVSYVLALLHADSLKQFNHVWLKINYGGARNPKYHDEPYFFNRNNFTSADWNPINQKQRYIKDATKAIKLNGQPIYKVHSTTINRKGWFDQQANTLKTIHLIRARYQQGVYTKKELSYLTHKLQNHYARRFINPKYYKNTVSITYIPKDLMTEPSVLNQIPTPSVLEIVRDDSDWFVSYHSIRAWLGSGINVSHVALLVREKFRYRQLIYRDIECGKSFFGDKVCHVKNVNCDNPQGCARLMYLAATDAYPDGYVWRVNSKTGEATCAAPKKPRTRKTVTCNRVLQMPLSAYLGTPSVTGNPSILGFHIERILPDKDIN